MGWAGGSVVEVVDVVDDVVDDVVLDVVDEVVDDVVLDVVEEVVLDDVDDVVDPPVTVTAGDGEAATGFVPVPDGAGAGPQPAGVGVPGVQLNVTALMPPGPTFAVVLLLPRRSAMSPPDAVHVVVGRFAFTDSGVAVSSPEVLFAG